jgi:hypothetical protein
MPQISAFFGITIYMYYAHGKHKEPYFHAKYQGHDASFSIKSLGILSGRLSHKAINLIQAWALTLQLELLENWDKVLKREPVKKIPGADCD